MNDDDLRRRLDLMVDRVPVQPAAEALVRARAGRTRRRRGVAAGAVLATAVVLAVALPETLQHQAKSEAAAGVPGRTGACTTALAQALRAYGEPQHSYGVRVTTDQAVAWASRPGSTFLAAPQGRYVDFCLSVGDLSHLATSAAAAGAEVLHYAVMADPQGAPELVWAGHDLPADPLPGVAAEQIAAYAHVPTPSSRATQPATLRPCVARDLVGQLSDVSLPDGLVQGEVVIVNTSSSSCRVSATMTAMVALTSSGQPLSVPAGGLPGPAHGVAVPYPVKEALPATALVNGGLPSEGPGAIVLTVGGDPSATACAAKDRSTRPAAFRFSIGTLRITVANHDPTTRAGAVRAIYGCPSRFYVGSVEGR